MDSPITWTNKAWESVDRMSNYAVQKLRKTVPCDGLPNHLDKQGMGKCGQNIKLCCADTKETACGHKGKDVKQLSPATQSTGHYLPVQSQGHPMLVTGRREYETKHRVWAFYPQRILSAQYTQECKFMAFSAQLCQQISNGDFYKGS